MLTVPAELLPLMGAFAPLFSMAVWDHAKVLLVGAILAPGKRTVTACLRVMGFEPAAVFRQLSPRLESCAMVAAGRQSHLAAFVGHALCPGRRAGLWIG